MAFTQVARKCKHDAGMVSFDCSGGWADCDKTLGASSSRLARLRVDDRGGPQHGAVPSDGEDAR